MDDFIEVMYNAKYGGFNYSPQAMQMYCEKTGKEYKDYQYSECLGIERTDKVMIEIVKELGMEANGPYANIQIARIPRQFEKHICYGEYDGYESVGVNYEAYRLQSIRDIVNDRDGEKIERIRNVLEMVFENEEKD